jgi:hypothetical protein
MKNLSHEQMMEKSWKFITDMEITEDQKELTDTGYLVKNIYKVRDAFYADLESGHDADGEDLPGFFARHGIAYQD